MLAELLTIDSATLTRTLAPLARRGWIRGERLRDRFGSDRWTRLLNDLASITGAAHADDPASL